jgi:hypothetical protein
MANHPGCRLIAQLKHRGYDPPFRHRRSRPGYECEPVISRSSVPKFYKSRLRQELAKSSRLSDSKLMASTTILSTRGADVFVAASAILYPDGIASGIQLLRSRLLKKSRLSP